MSNELRIGPMKPDEVAATSKGLRQDAMSMIQAVQAAYPPELRAALQRNVDEAGSAVLDAETMSATYGVNVLDGAVMGLPGSEQTICYIYEDESGRVARWFEPVKGSVFEPQIVDASNPKPEPAPESAPAPEPGPEPAAAAAASDEYEDDEDEPWPGYDSETVAEIQAKLEDLDQETLEDVSVYERAHKARKGVLEQVDELLAG